MHRIGRTGRAGKSGLALSFASGRDLTRLRNIERFTKQRITRQSVPTLVEVETAQHTEIFEKIREVLAEGKLERFSATLNTLINEDTTVSDVACALLKMAIPAAPKREIVEFEGESSRFGRDSNRDSNRYESRGSDRGLDRGNSREKPRGKPGQTYSVDGLSATITINIGKAKGAMPKDIVGALTGETGFPGKTFGNIDMFPNHTTVAVPKDRLNEIVTRFQNIRIKGIKVFAKPS